MFKLVIDIVPAILKLDIMTNLIRWIASPEARAQFLTLMRKETPDSADATVLTARGLRYDLA